MTLSQLAAFVTAKLSDTETASVSICKDFINRRHQMIWDGALFTETLGVVTKAVVAGDTELTLSGAPSITFYQSASVPTTFLDFPVAMKFTYSTATDGSELIGNDWQTFFQIDVNAWNSDTSYRTLPTNFINLPKDGSGYCRIKPVPVPDAAGTMYILGKLKCVALGDNDSPSIRGIDNALLSFAEGDMLERARQYGKAQSKYAEAMSHIKLMTDIEKGQQQSISRITPMEEGIYDPAGGPQ